MIWIEALKWWVLKSLVLAWILSFVTAGALEAQDQESLPDVGLWQSDRTWWFDLKWWLNWTAALTVDKNWIVRTWPSLRLLEALYKNEKWWIVSLWVEFAPQVEVAGDDFGKPEIGLGLSVGVQSPRWDKLIAGIAKTLNESLVVFWLRCSLSWKNRQIRYVKVYFNCLP